MKSVLERVPGKRRIHMIADSDSESDSGRFNASDANECLNKRGKLEISMDRKESGLFLLTEKAPEYELIVSNYC